VFAAGDLSGLVSVFCPSLKEDDRACWPESERSLPRDAARASDQLDGPMCALGGVTARREPRLRSERVTVEREWANARESRR
jgi:hypothetical protein